MHRKWGYNTKREGEGGREEESEYERGSSAKSSEGDLKANR